jgi:hypothetical protein
MLLCTEIIRSLSPFMFSERHKKFLGSIEIRVDPKEN